MTLDLYALGKRSFDGETKPNMHFVYLIKYVGWDIVPIGYLPF